MSERLPAEIAQKRLRMLFGWIVQAFRERLETLDHDQLKESFVAAVTAPDTNQMDDTALQVHFHARALVAVTEAAFILHMGEDPDDQLVEIIGEFCNQAGLTIPPPEELEFAAGMWETDRIQ